MLGVLKKKAIVFLLSDFIDNNYEKTLQIAIKKHDFTGIRIYDKIETSFPNIGMVPLIDNESKKINWINTSLISVRNNYKKNYEELVYNFKEIFKKNGGGIIDCCIDESYVKKLLGYFKARI